MNVVGLLDDYDLADKLFMTAKEADAHTGGQYFRERAAIQHNALVVHALDGGNIRSGKAQLTIRVVLQNHNAVLFGKCQHGFAFFERHGDAGGVLEGRDQINELDLFIGL